MVGGCQRFRWGETIPVGNFVHDGMQRGAAWIDGAVHGRVWVVHAETI